MLIKRDEISTFNISVFWQMSTFLSFANLTKTKIYIGLQPRAGACHILTNSGEQETRLRIKVALLGELVWRTVYLVYILLPWDAVQKGGAICRYCNLVVSQPACYQFAHREACSRVFLAWFHRILCLILYYGTN